MSTQIKKKKEREKKMLNLVDAGKRYHVKKGDEVRVLAGENRGKRGKIREIISGNDRAILQSLDDGPAALKGYKQHKKRSNDLPNGAIVDQDPSIHISSACSQSSYCTSAASPHGCGGMLQWLCDLQRETAPLPHLLACKNRSALLQDSHPPAQSILHLLAQAGTSLQVPMLLLYGF